MRWSEEPQKRRGSALVRAGSVVAGLAIGCGGAAYAQTAPTRPTVTVATAPLAGLLPQFVSDAAVNATGSGGFDHTQHFVRGLQTSPVPLELTSAIAAGLPAFPAGSGSTGLFAGNGAARDRAAPFAPVFGESARTVGKGRFDLGFSYRRTRADAFSGVDLDSGEINFYVPHNDCCPGRGNPAAPTDLTPDFERDVLQQTLALELHQSVAVLTATLGVTDRLDVGVAVPVVKLDMHARITSRIHRTATAATPSVHSFDGIDLANRTLYRSGSATGLGDVIVRAKLNALRTDTGGVAVGVDVRLPTGDEDELLGLGARQVRATIAGSGQAGRWTPFFNVGYTKSDGETTALAATYPGALAEVGVDRSLSDQIDYAGGVGLGLAPWMAVGLEIVGQTLLDGHRFGVGTTTFPSRGPTGAPAREFAPTDALLLESRGTVNRALGVASVRVRAGSRLVLTATMLLPVADEGLRPKARPTFGIDYVF
jgi:hypothetical protein